MLSVSFNDLPDNAIRQIIGNLDKEGLKNCFTTSTRLYGAAKPRCEVEELLTWIRASLAHENTETFQKPWVVSFCKLGKKDALNI